MNGAESALSVVQSRPSRSDRTSCRIGRIISIGTEATYRVRLLSDSTPVMWRPVAKDGADLPATRAVSQPAVVVMGAGETLDVEVMRNQAERLTLELRKDGVTITRVAVVVR